MDAVLPLDADLAFAALLAGEAPALAALARRLLGSEAEDALQEAWIRAWTRRGALREPAATRAWLRRIVLRECLRALRWRGLRRWLPFAEPPEMALEADPADTLALARARRAVEALPARQRAMWGLRFDEGWTIPEIAEALEVSPETVKTQLGRALQRVQQEVGDV